MRPEIREVVRRGYGDLVEHVERVSGLPASGSHFFAKGMLLNVMASMDLLGSTEAGRAWSRLPQDV